jgi:hypothetical protein
MMVRFRRSMSSQRGERAIGFFSKMERDAFGGFENSNRPTSSQSMRGMLFFHVTLDALTAFSAALLQLVPADNLQVAAAANEHSIFLKVSGD